MTPLVVFDNVKRYADKRNVSLTYVEKQAELGNGAITKWRYGFPNLNNIVKVAKVLGVTLDELVQE